jgi:hypothetical protein
VVDLTNLGSSDRFRKVDRLGRWDFNAEQMESVGAASDRHRWRIDVEGLLAVINNWGLCS